MTEIEQLRLDIQLKRNEILENMVDNLCDLRGYLSRLTVAVESFEFTHMEIHRLLTLLTGSEIEVLHRSDTTTKDLK